MARSYHALRFLIASVAIVIFLVVPIAFIGNSAARAAGCPEKNKDGTCKPTPCGPGGGDVYKPDGRCGLGGDGTAAGDIQGTKVDPQQLQPGSTINLPPMTVEDTVPNPEALNWDQPGGERQLPSETGASVLNSYGYPNNLNAINNIANPGQLDFPSTEGAQMLPFSPGQTSQLQPQFESQVPGTVLDTSGALPAQATGFTGTAPVEQLSPAAQFFSNGATALAQGFESLVDMAKSVAGTLTEAAQNLISYLGGEPPLATSLDSPVPQELQDKVIEASSQSYVNCMEGGGTDIECQNKAMTDGMKILQAGMSNGQFTQQQQLQEEKVGLQEELAQGELSKTDTDAVNKRIADIDKQLQTLAENPALDKPALNDRDLIQRQIDLQLGRTPGSAVTSFPDFKLIDPAQLGGPTELPTMEVTTEEKTPLVESTEKLMDADAELGAAKQELEQAKENDTLAAKILHAVGVGADTGAAVDAAQKQLDAASASVAAARAEVDRELESLAASSPSTDAVRALSEAYEGILKDAESPAIGAAPLTGEGPTPASLDPAPPSSVTDIAKDTPLTLEQQIAANTAQLQENGIGNLIDSGRIMYELVGEGAQLLESEVATIASELGESFAEGAALVGEKIADIWNNGGIDLTSGINDAIAKGDLQQPGTEAYDRLAKDTLGTGDGRGICGRGICSNQFTQAQLQGLQGKVIEGVSTSMYQEREGTAYGGTNDPNQFTTASKEFPSNARILEYNPETGAAAVVRVNDTGPFVGDRRLDTTPAALNAIGAGGLSKLDVSYLGQTGPTGYLGKFDSIDAAISSYATANNIGGIGNLSSPVSNFSDTPLAGFLTPSVSGLSPGFSETPFGVGGLGEPTLTGGAGGTIPGDVVSNFSLYDYNQQPLSGGGVGSDVVAGGTESEPIDWSKLSNGPIYGPGAELANGPDASALAPVGEQTQFPPTETGELAKESPSWETIGKMFEEANARIAEKFADDWASLKSVFGLSSPPEIAQAPIYGPGAELASGPDDPALAPATNDIAKIQARVDAAQEELANFYGKAYEEIPRRSLDDPPYVEALRKQLAANELEANTLQGTEIQKQINKLDDAGVASDAPERTQLQAQLADIKAERASMLAAQAQETSALEQQFAEKTNYTPAELQQKITQSEESLERVLGPGWEKLSPEKMDAFSAKQAETLAWMRDIQTGAQPVTPPPVYDVAQGLGETQPLEVGSTPQGPQVSPEGLVDPTPNEPAMLVDGRIFPPSATIDWPATPSGVGSIEGLCTSCNLASVGFPGAIAVPAEPEILAALWPGSIPGALAPFTATNPYSERFDISMGQRFGTDMAEYLKMCESCITEVPGAQVASFEQRDPGTTLPPATSIEQAWKDAARAGADIKGVPDFDNKGNITGVRLEAGGSAYGPGTPQFNEFLKSVSVPSDTPLSTAAAPAPTSPGETPAPTPAAEAGPAKTTPTTPTPGKTPPASSPAPGPSAPANPGPSRTAAAPASPSSSGGDGGIGSILSGIMPLIKALMQPTPAAPSAAPATSPSSPSTPATPTSAPIAVNPVISTPSINDLTPFTTGVGSGSVFSSLFGIGSSIGASAAQSLGSLMLPQSATDNIQAIADGAVGTPLTPDPTSTDGIMSLLTNVANFLSGILGSPSAPGASFTSGDLSGAAARTSGGTQPVSFQSFLGSLATFLSGFVASDTH